MNSKQSGSMDTLITCVSNSFKQAPLSAIPSMLDCVLASTAFSPSSLFDSILDSAKDFDKDEKELDSGHRGYLTSMVGALCHLLKKPEIKPNSMRSFIWNCFIPLMKMAHAFERGMLNQIAGLFFDAVSVTDSWGVLEATLVPFFLRSAGVSIYMLPNEESDIFEWAEFLISLNGQIDDHLDKDCMLSLSVPFPLSISCHILGLILESSLQNLSASSTAEPVVENGFFCAEKLFRKLLWDLCNLSERLLSHSLEHRSCAIGFLLPVLCKAFVSHYSLKISNRDSTSVLSRNLFFRKMWHCCRLLFCQGQLERRDAYCVLSLLLSFFSCKEQCENDEARVKAEKFDIRAEREFWDELKKGLVDTEILIRKQSLHILQSVLQIKGEIRANSSNPVKRSEEKNSNSNGITKRALWADKEAKSLGVGKVCNSVDSPLDGQQQWEAFILLYEMLEEYGTHLVEAAWEHQVALLLQHSVSHDNFASSICGVLQKQTGTLDEVFSWLAILWQLGFHHDNPQVRCLIMQSFLGIEWVKYGDAAASVPESFVLGSFLEGLNDPTHHKDFGLKGVYTSKTIEGAASFLLQYTKYLDARKGISFLHSLASVAKHQSFGRAGLMGLAECIASVACGVRSHDGNEEKWTQDSLDDEIQMGSSSENLHHVAKVDMLDAFRYVIDSSKQHFNPHYRLQVCEKVLVAAASVVSTHDVPLEVLLLFVSSMPREFTDYGGPLKQKMQDWLLRVDENCCSANYYNSEIQLLKSLQEFPERFTSFQRVVDGCFSFDDEDLDAWEFEAKRWARVLFLVIKGENHLAPIFKFLHGCGVNIFNHAGSTVKFLVLIMNLISEIQILWEIAVAHGGKFRPNSEISLFRTAEQLGSEEAFAISEKFSDIFLSILEELVCFTRVSCSIFGTNSVKDTDLPSSVRGRLGGPSQRRLSSATATTVLEAITSIKVVASVVSGCSHFKSDVQLKDAYTFMWKFFVMINSSPTCDSESEAEVRLAAYEALASVLRALVFPFSPLSLDIVRESHSSSPSAESRGWLDHLVLSFLQNINNLLAVGVLVRTRKAVLLSWKWLCLESLLSIPHCALKNGLYLEGNGLLFSDEAIRCIFGDLVDSLETAGEGCVLPMLRSIRLTLELLTSERAGSPASSCKVVDAQMIWHLVHSSWILHVSNDKRRVAAIAALLSSVLHASVFADEVMHSNNNAPGPLKWFVQNILEEGTKSPRTIRLAALHLTGLWLSHPRIIKYYINELKLLTLYGSVAFDEDFEAELAYNRDAKTEVSLLAKSPDYELTEVFINTELYARVSVAVLFYKLTDMADLVGSEVANEDCCAALESGKFFLLELLDSVVNDKDLSKELYKKYSGIHRRKIRAWQMICVLSRFVTNDILGKVMCSLHLALYRNNLPAVRQYLETFAINIYLKFPSLVGEQLVPILRDYEMRPQALSSYVFIAANIILHASKEFQSRHLNELLPPIVPLLTSHHHSLRGFTQLLVYQVLSKIFTPLAHGASETMDLEKRSFEDLKLYLAKNPDCRRLRASMEGFLDGYDPIFSCCPSGIFVNRVEELQFECVPTSLMEEVLNFLNDVREDLRFSMANDVVTIKNESFKIDEDFNSKRILPNKELRKEASLNFQKKITPDKREKRDAESSSILGNNVYKHLFEMEKEDELLESSLQSRILTLERNRASRQHFILVASFLDRIPNLAGLARTCEVFKASGLAIADKSILNDKQFQLISVTAEKWVPIIEVPVNSVKQFLEKKKQEGYSILGLEQTANSVPLDQYAFPKNTVLVLGREKEGVPVDIIHILDACIEIPQLGVVRSLNVHVSGAIALWEYTRQHRSQ